MQRYDNHLYFDSLEQQVGGLPEDVGLDETLEAFDCAYEELENTRNEKERLKAYIEQYSSAFYEIADQQLQERAVFGHQLVEQLADYAAPLIVQELIGSLGVFEH